MGTALFQKETIEYEQKSHEILLDVPEMHECCRCRHRVEPHDKVEKKDRSGWTNHVCKKCGCKTFSKVKVINASH